LKVSAEDRLRSAKDRGLRLASFQQLRSSGDQAGVIMREADEVHSDSIVVIEERIRDAESFVAVAVTYIGATIISAGENRAQYN
jgi:hypothetical protein